MNAPLAQPLTMAQFLAWEERQELRYEFDGTSVTAMTGGTYAHSSRQAGLMRVLGVHLLGTRCHPHAGAMKVKMADTVRYPDVLVNCAPRGPNATFVTEPVVVFEVLSKSTHKIDLGAKRAEYQATPSVQRYVVLEQSHRAAHVFARNADEWDSELHLGENAILDMPEIGIAITLGEIYRGITLASDPQ